MGDPNYIDDIPFNFPMDTSLQSKMIMEEVDETTQS
jgi:hypothetical protein